MQSSGNNYFQVRLFYYSLISNYDMRRCYLVSVLLVHVRISIIFLTIINFPQRNYNIHAETQN